METFNFTLKPQILTSPHVPKPLHGTNPRTIFGDKWWDEKRQEAYARYNYHCVACGVHKSKAKKFKWLEAHEDYVVDYFTGTVKITEIEPLCHYCHNFIHSGRLSKIINKQKTTKEVIDILEHGFEILSKNNLGCYSFTFDFAKSLGAETFYVKKYTLNGRDIPWAEWSLEYEGKSYKGKFASYEEWSNYYNGNE